MKVSIVHSDKCQNEGCTNRKALVYHGPGKRSLEEKPKPIVKEPIDAVVKITRTTICRTDLHIIKAYDTLENAANEKALKVILTY